MGDDTFIGFLIDWLIELISVVGCAIAITACTSLYTGLCFYIDGMVTDFRNRIDTIYCYSVTRQKNITGSINAWLVYVEEFQFHIEIVE